jgi:hypothetical protein
VSLLVGKRDELLMTGHNYNHGSMSRKRKVAIVVPCVDQPTRGAVLKAWNDGESFRVLTREGPGKTITRETAATEGLAEVTLCFDGNKQTMHVKVTR